MEKTRNNGKVSPAGKENPESGRSDHTGRDGQVEDALFRNACGYRYTEDTVTKIKTVTYHPETGKKLAETEEVVVTPVEKLHNAETAAAKFWLQLRQRERWGDETEEIPPEIRVTMEGLEGFAD